MSSREEAFNCIQDLKLKYGEKGVRIHEANEAKTRVILIDRILNSLGWDNDDFNPETPAGSEYIDYLLSVDGIPKVIVEAKRLGTTFPSPSKQLREVSYSLSYFKSAYGRALSRTLEQATSYAIKTEVPYTVLTNGAEWFVVQVLPLAGQKPENLKGYYFGNLLSDHSNFDLFWEIFSKQSVSEGYLEERLFSLNSSPAKEVRVASHEVSGLAWKRNSSDKLIGEFYYHFFAEMTDSRRREMLTKCFTEDAQLRQYQSDLKSALQDTAPTYISNETIDQTPGEGEKSLLAQTGDIAGRVILIVGSVGCGKSTLVSKVVVEAKQGPERNLLVVKIDLIDEVAKAEGDISPTIWKYIDKEWRDLQPDSYSLSNLKTYFHRELEDLKRGEESALFKIDENEYIKAEARTLKELRQDHLTFFEKCWKYYNTAKRYGIALVIDNVDRASEDFQEQVYAFAHKIARRTGATVVITLREFTFFRAKEEGVLDVRTEDTVIHLQSPNLEQLLSRRIKYVLEDVQNDFRIKTWRERGNLEEFLSASREYANTLKVTFLESGNSGRSILGLLASVAWHNVRYFLEVLRRIHIQLGENKNPWTETEVIAALLTTNTADKTLPIIPNIYRPPYPNYQCYFLKLRVLLLLINGSKSNNLRQGARLPKLLSFSRLYGYQTDWTTRAIEELVQERLLECLEAPLASDYTKDYKLDKSHSFRVSPLSVVMADRIIYEMVYLSLIGHNLPFYDLGLFEKYKGIFDAVSATLDDGQLERDAIDLFLETELGKLVSSYLLEMAEHEKPSNPSLLNAPEISAVESSLESIICHMKVCLPNLHSVHNSPLIKGLEHQGSLFDNYYKPQDILSEGPSPEGDLTDVKTLGENIFLVNVETAKKVPIPESISDMKISKSEQAPLIFWALAALKAADRSWSSGTEVTEVINLYLVDDHNKKFPNNISRALRSTALTTQCWLAVDDSLKRKRFGLAKDWKNSWVTIFEEPAPDI